MGWIVPSPRKPTKSNEEFKRERKAKVGELRTQGFLKSERIRKAMLKVPREVFIPSGYKDYAYHEDRRVICEVLYVNLKGIFGKKSICIQIFGNKWRLPLNFESIRY